MYTEKRLTVIWLCKQCSKSLGNLALIDTKTDPKMFIKPSKTPKCPICNKRKYMVAYESTFVIEEPDPPSVIEEKSKPIDINDINLISPL